MTVAVPLANGRGVALVDAEDAARVLRYSWSLSQFGGKRYARRGDRTGWYMMHREILGLGPHTPDSEVDHIDGDGLNNTRTNLRVGTHAENQQNMKAHRDGSSKYRGVSWDKRRSMWAVRVSVAGKTHWGGYFAGEDAAGLEAADLRARLMQHAMA